MAVLERSELEASPLADLHAIANQVGLEGFRRLRKADLIDAILGESSPRRREDGDAGGDDALRVPHATAARARGRASAPDVRLSTQTPSRRPARSRRRVASARAAAAPRTVAAGARRSGAPRAARAGRGSPTQPPRPSPGASPRAWSRCWATARRFCASIRPSPPTRTSTSPPLRCAAASSSPATASPARCARRGAPSVTRRWCASTRSTARRRTPCQTEAATTSFPSTGRASASRSARRTHARGDRVADPARSRLARR